MTSFTDKSYWLTTRPYAPCAPLSDHRDVDVAIIGGGFTGLATAHFLSRAQPGLRIAIVEAQVIGYGASGRNAGFSMTKIGMMHSMTRLRFGSQRTIEAHEYADRAVSLLRSLVQGEQLDCDYQHVGFLWVATSPKFAQRQQAELDLIHRLGISGIEAIDAAALAGRVHSPLYVGGAWWEPNCGILNPAKLAWAWRDIVQRAGVEVFENSPVVDVCRVAGRSLVTTAKGALRADKVVFATNAWSHQFAPMAKLQTPVWTYIILTEPLSDAQWDAIGWAGREGIEDFRDLVHYYRRTVDGRLLFGGRDVGVGDGGRTMAYDRDSAVFAALRRDLVATFPVLKGVSITHEWGGPVSATLDLFPAMGYAGGRDWLYSLGCVGHGVSTTHLNGQTLADLAIERTTDLTDTFFVNRRIVPMPPGPLRRPVIAGIAGFMRWEDRRYDSLPS